MSWIQIFWVHTFGSWKPLVALVNKSLLVPESSIRLFLSPQGHQGSTHPKPCGTLVHPAHHSRGTCGVKSIPGHHESEGPAGLRGLRWTGRGEGYLGVAQIHWCWKRNPQFLQIHILSVICVVILYILELSASVKFFPGLNFATFPPLVHSFVPVLKPCTLLAADSSDTAASWLLNTASLNQTSEIRQQTSDVRNQTADVRQRAAAWGRGHAHGDARPRPEEDHRAGAQGLRTGGEHSMVKIKWKVRKLS